MFLAIHVQPKIQCRLDEDVSDNLNCHYFCEEIKHSIYKNKFKLDAICNT